MRIYVDFDDCLCETGRAFSTLAYEPCGEAMDGVTLHCVRMEKDL